MHTVKYWLVSSPEDGRCWPIPMRVALLDLITAKLATNRRWMNPNLLGNAGLAQAMVTKLTGGTNKMRTPDQIADKSESSIKSQSMISPCLCTMALHIL